MLCREEHGSLIVLIAFRDGTLSVVSPQYTPSLFIEDAVYATSDVRDSTPAVKHVPATKKGRRGADLSKMAGGIALRHLDTTDRLYFGSLAFFLPLLAVPESIPPRYHLRCLGDWSSVVVDEKLNVALP